MINPLIYGLITGLIKPLIGSGGDSACNVYLSGTQLFLLDSLTAGPGSTKSPVYYIAKTAKENNRLRYITARMLKGHAPDTETIISDNLGTSSSVTDSVYSPSQACVEVDGSEALEILTIGNGNYNWLTARLYFEKKVGGGSFGIVEPVVINNISTDGDAGDIGYIDITNPTPTESTAIRVSNFTGSVRFSLLRRLIEDVETDYLDVLNLAYSGQTTADYNLVTNISDWYTELGIEQAIVNTATNGSKIYSEHIIEFRKLMDDLASAGVTGQDVLIMRPNDNARKLGDLWEDIRDEYNTRFTSIVRIYGDLAEFQANNWMLPSDTTHPNETFNAIQATQEYALNLVDLHDQIDLGVQANWITEFNNLMWIQYDSTVTVSGDFSMQLRVRVDNRQFYLWDNEGDNRNSCRINTNGSIRLEIDNVITDSAAGGVSQNSWHTLDIERSGTTLTVDCDGVEVMNATVSTLDILFTRTGRSAAAYLIRGAMAWFTVTGQHQWLFNQSPYDTVIPDLTGSTDATWVGILDVKDNPLKLSVLPDGELLDYHYNVRTGVYWGDVTWPTGA